MAEQKSLERVIENLLSNAIKYAKDNVDISLEKEENRALLKISNAIVNLTLQDVENIFERFYMADKTRSGKGTGLGLAITKGLVEKMNGNIIADMKGDIFNIYCRFRTIKE
nr:sensor histidine kinase [Clostridium frigidicarnis]